MILTLDVGNSHMYGGVFLDETLQLRFRMPTNIGSTSDQIGIFLKACLRENNIDCNNITAIAFCSVVPQMDYSLISACRKYFHLDPFILQAGVKTGLKIKYYNPQEVGSDRIANAIAALALYPNKNILIVDFGTATTFCAINADKEYLGGIILPGMGLSMQALQERAAKLPSVKILKPENIIGRSTIESIQSGLYHGQLGAIHKITEKLSTEVFRHQDYIIIGTGGFAYLFEDENIFTSIHGDLVHQGLRLALLMNGQ